MISLRLSSAARLASVFAFIAVIALSNAPHARAQGLKGEYPYIIRNAADPQRCLIFSENGNAEHPERYNWGGQGICGLTDDRSAFIANKQATWRLESLGNDQYLIKSGVDPTNCLVMGDNGRAQYPILSNWGHGPVNCGFASSNELLANKQAVWHLQHLANDQYLIKNSSAGSEQCLAFGNNGADQFPSRYPGPGTGDAYCHDMGGSPDANARWLIDKVPPDGHTIPVCNGSAPVSVAANEISNVIYVKCIDRIEAVDVSKAYAVNKTTNLADADALGIAFNDATQTLYVVLNVGPYGVAHVGHVQILALAMDGVMLRARNVIDLPDLHPAGWLAVNRISKTLFFGAYNATTNGLFAIDNSSPMHMRQISDSEKPQFPVSDDGSSRIFFSPYLMSRGIDLYTCVTEPKPEACVLAARSFPDEGTVDPSTGIFLAIAPPRLFQTIEVTPLGRVRKLHVMPRDNDFVAGLVAASGKLYAFRIRQDASDDGLTWLRATDAQSGAAAGSWYLGDVGRPFRRSFSINRLTNKLYVIHRNQLVELDLNAPH